MGKNKKHYLDVVKSEMTVTYGKSRTVSVRVHSLFLFFGPGETTFISLARSIFCDVAGVF